MCQCQSHSTGELCITSGVLVLWMNLWYCLQAPLIAIGFLFTLQERRSQEEEYAGWWWDNLAKFCTGIKLAELWVFEEGNFCAEKHKKLPTFHLLPFYLLITDCGYTASPSLPSSNWNGHTRILGNMWCWRHPLRETSEIDRSGVKKDANLASFPLFTRGVYIFAVSQQRTIDCRV